MPGSSPGRPTTTCRHFRSTTAETTTAALRGLLVERSVQGNQVAEHSHAGDEARKEPRAYRLALCDAFEFWWGLAGELSITDHEAFETCEVSEFGWDLTGQLICIEGKALEVGEGSKFGWDLTGQLILREVEGYEVCEVREFSWDLT